MGTTPEAIQKANKLDKNFTVQAGQELKIPDVKFRNIDAQPKTSKQKLQPSLKTSEIKKSKNIETKTGSPRETLLRKAAAAGGITDHVELAAFLAQATVETGRFGDLDEKGSRKRIERMYDPKYNPGGASAIGNTKIGDGWRYRGRGFLQLTGRYNYTAASRSLGLDLVRNPDLVLKPEIAATTAVWYWKWRVRPNVSDFHDTEKITALVQGKDKHLDRRQKAFRDFLQFQMAQI
jgi:predicted chitinase